MGTSKVDRITVLKVTVAICKREIFVVTVAG